MALASIAMLQIIPTVVRQRITRTEVISNVFSLRNLLLFGVGFGAASTISTYMGNGPVVDRKVADPSGGGSGSELA